MLGKGEDAVAFADRDRPNLTGPGVDAIENATVDLLEVVQVVDAYDRVDQQAGDTNSGDVCFAPSKLLGFSDFPAISENSRPGIDVGVVGDVG